MSNEQRTVERFFVAGSTGYKSFNDYGDCVKYEDYERLEKERDEQGRNAVELFDECQRLKEIERKLQADNKALREALEGMLECAGEEYAGSRYVEAARAALAPPDGEPQ